MDSKPLIAIRNQILAAFKEGRLYSYDRQPPKGQVLKSLGMARTEVVQILADEGYSDEATRLLALIQEALTQYAAAVRTLELLVSNGSATKADLKRLAACRIAQAEAASPKDRLLIEDES